MSLWQWRDLLDACGIQNPAEGPNIEGISLDSRTVVAGDLFIALSGDPGPRFHSSSASDRDGHDFVENAEENGAVAVMVSRNIATNCSVIEVPNTLNGLWQLGEFARKRMRGRVVAITGSAGKTTARQWLEQILGNLGSTHASTASLNNHWGVPLSLARMPASSQYGVFEVGTNRPGEIEPLAELVSPQVSVLLNVLPAHIGNFDNLDAIRQEKLTIASPLEKGGTLIVPADLDLSGLKHGNIVTFGLTEDADVFGKALFLPQYTEVDASVLGTRVSYRLVAGGEHRVLTSLAVLAAAYCLVDEVDLNKVCDGFSKLTTPKGRGNVNTIAGVTVIDDSYNANPITMAYAISAIAKGNPSGKKVALLGEMLELGDESQLAHAETSRLAEETLDGFITVGEGFISCPGNWGHVGFAAQVDLDELVRSLKPGDTLLVKGSNKIFWTEKFVDRLLLSLEAVKQA